MVFKYAQIYMLFYTYFCNGLYLTQFTPSKLTFYGADLTLIACVTLVRKSADTTGFAIYLQIFRRK
jgi:hypothetical protein